MNELKFKGNNKHTGWAVATEKRDWHYFTKYGSLNRSICKMVYTAMKYVFVPKISKHSEICPQCRRLAKDKLK